MNIKFSYLYRDCANYKQYNEIVFSNPELIAIDEIKKNITDNLIDGEWFVAIKWGWPDLHSTIYDWDESIDHEWHEFVSVEETSDAITSSTTVNDFISIINLSTLQ